MRAVRDATFVLLRILGLRIVPDNRWNLAKSILRNA